MNNKLLLLVAAAVFGALGVAFYLKQGSKHQHANIVLMNVLDKEYFEDCYIPGSVNVPVEQVEKYVQQLSKDDTIVVYCANYACTASGSVAEQLIGLGFKHVYAYEAGIAGWYTAGYPCVGQCTQGYLKAPNTPLEHGDAKHSYAIIETAALKKMIDDCTADSKKCSCCAGHHTH